MSIAGRMHNRKWAIAESHLIAQEAVERFIEVEPWDVYTHLETWRLWFHGIVPTSYVLSLPHVRQIPVSGR